MFHGMSATPTAFDPECAIGSQRAIIRRNPDNVDEIEMVEAIWGSSPHIGEGRSFRFVRAEARTFPSHRCLIAASEFHMGVGGRRYCVTLESGNFFYLAGIWAPATDEWALSYRIVTVAANPEVAHYQERHGAIIQRRQVMQWLDLTLPALDLLVTPSARTFHIEEIGARQPRLAV
jgi:putative SOS response-associated peptidase YedK